MIIYLLDYRKFVPGCGPKLIKEGIDICSKFKDLTPKQLLDLFKLYKSWPEYDENAFCPTVISENKVSNKYLKLAFNINQYYNYSYCNFVLFSERR